MADLIVEKHGHVTVFTLNRPDKLNAMTVPMREALVSGMAEFDRDPEQHVAVLTGAGDRAFSAGADLGELSASAKATGNVEAASVDIFGVGSSPKPTIAAVNGLAVASGFELALNCDIRIAADTAWFGLFEVKRGIMAGVGVNLLARYLPLGDALYLLMTADRLSVEDALRHGLIQRAVPRADVMDVALEIAEKIAANSQPAVQASKQVAYFWRNLAVRESLDYYRSVNRRLMLCDDVLEGPRAFAEKREPRFTNRWPEPTR